MEIKCKKCMWWDCEHVSVKNIAAIEWKPDPGFCRKHRPGAVMIDKNYIGIQPIMDADEFCGEFKE